MRDLISRQAAIDVIFSEPLYESGMKKRDADAVVLAIYEKIKSLSSAQTNLDHIYAELSKVYNVKGLPDEAIGIIGDLMLSLDGPSAQPVLDRTKISNLLEKIYSIQSVHLSVEGVLARKYYCKQLWMELFGSEDVPTWMI